MAPLYPLNIISIPLLISYTLQNNSTINILSITFGQSLLFAVFRQNPYWKVSKFEGTILLHKLKHYTLYLDF